MSNRTLKNNVVKIESAPKRAIFVLVFLCLVVIGLLVWSPSKAKGNFGNKNLDFEKVISHEAKTKGLSGRQSLKENQGMVFIYEQPGKLCFWMKDMKFAIDMVWLNSAKVVQEIRENVSPDTYPQNFCPEQPAQYVVEVVAGLAKKAKVTTGSQLQF